MKASSLTIENFKELIDSNAYYVDKTQLIIDYIKERRVLYIKDMESLFIKRNVM